MPGSRSDRTKRQVDELLERSRTAVETSHRLIRKMKRLSKEWETTRAELHRNDGKIPDLPQPVKTRKRKPKRKT